MLRLFLAVMLSAGTASAATINVPDDITTIQGGIGAAANGDTVLVAPGTYRENIDFLGKDIVVGSHYIVTRDTTFVNQTTISSSRLDHVIRFDKGESQKATLSGFLITGGNVKKYNYSSEEANGGGIYIIDSSPIIEHCIIKNNRAVVVRDYTSYSYTYGKGGGVYINGGSAIIRDTSIYDNNAADSPGGYFRTNEKIQLERVIIALNVIECAEYSAGMCNGSGFNTTVVNTDIIDCYITLPSSNVGDSDRVIMSVDKSGNSIISGSNIQGLNAYGTTHVKNTIISGAPFEFAVKVAIYCHGDFPMTFENIVIEHTGKSGLTCFLCNQSSPNIINCVMRFSDYTTSYPCMVIKTQNGSPILQNITAYFAPDIPIGCFLANYGGSVTLMNSVILGGRTGIFNEDNGSVDIKNCLFRDIKNNVFSGCQKELGEIVTTNRNGTPTDIYGNIFVDPGFVSSTDFHLKANSPCIGAGLSEGAPEFDIEGTPRGAPPDMGAYEHPYDWPGSAYASDGDETTPAPFHLGNPHPNPFNPSTVIPFTLADKSQVTLTVYNLLGEKTAVVAKNALYPAGNHEITWNAAGCASGVYLVRLESGGHAKTVKALLLK